MLIDAHHHLWKYSAAEYGWINDQMTALRRDFLVAELDEVVAGASVDGFISVQARQSIAETQALIEFANNHPKVLGVVGWVPLADENVSEHLDALAESRWLKGVRHVVQDEPDDRFLLREAFNRGVRALRRHGLVYDILIYARQLPAAIEFADLHTDQPMVLDHIAKPTIAKAKFDARWEKNIRELARRPHITCKFSGVVTEIHDSGSDWTIDDIRPYWDVALEAFTPQRLMFGSDWPVCLLRSSYDRWLATVRELAQQLSPSEQADFFAGTALRAYSCD